MKITRATGEMDVPPIDRAGPLTGRPSSDERASPVPDFFPHHNDQSDSGSAGEKLDAFNQAGNRIQELVEQIDALPNSPARVLFQECLESVLAFYGHGLERILQLVAHGGNDGQKIYRDLIHDNVVRGLLLIHDLHPVDLKPVCVARWTRFVHTRRATRVGRPDQRRGKLRLQGTCQSCASSTVTLELAIRHAVEEACPDLIGFEVEGAPAQSTGATLPPEARRATPDWVVIDNALQLRDEAGMSVRVGDLRLIVCRVSGNLYAYRNNCPTCNMPLNAGMIDSGLLQCGLGHRYDVQHAGRSSENPDLHLDPFPLLIRDGLVKVAVVSEASRFAREYRAKRDGSCSLTRTTE
jgi:nitrite reductase/ring-hydroxylating ferredoxin subunit